MNILFIYTLLDRPFLQKKALNSWTKIQLGISYISSLLKKAGHPAHLLIPRIMFYRHDIKKSIKEFQPDVVCFTGISSIYPYIEKIARYTRKKAPNAFLIIGGPHASLHTREVFMGPYDAVCVGEGEYPMLDVVSALERKEQPSGIANMRFKRDGTVGKNSNREFIENLDKLPFPDRKMWRPWIQNDKHHVILLGRGCLWSCTYCCNHAFRRVAKGNYVRHRTTSNVINEMKQLCNDFPDVSKIYFEVESVANYPHWILQLCKSLEKFNAARERPLEFGTNIRAHSGINYKEIFQALRRAGFTEINIGIESGSESLRADVLRRLESNEELVKTCDEAHDSGLSINAYNMIGLPGESVQDFKKTIELNRRCEPAQSYLSIYYPYPGTHLYRQCEIKGLFARDKKQNPERFKPVLKLPQFPQRKILHYFRWFDWYVYSGKKSSLHILGQMLYRWIGGHWFFLQIYRSIMSFRLFSSRTGRNGKEKDFVGEAECDPMIPDQKEAEEIPESRTFNH
jgi:radical SAM superfamily enzyme YgiQ (UPF0313 family)